MIHVISKNGSPPATIVVGGFLWLTMSQCIYTNHDTYIGYICETNRFHLGWLWGQIKWMWLWYHLHYNTFCLIVERFGTTSNKASCSTRGSHGTSSTRVPCSSTSVASGTNSTRACCFHQVQTLNCATFPIKFSPFNANVLHTLDSQGSCPC